MESIMFENKINHDKFLCDNIKDIRIIDGVEYLPVHTIATNRIVLIRKDTLQKVKK